MLSAVYLFTQNVPKSEAGTIFPAEIGVASLGCEIFGREALLCFMFESQGRVITALESLGTARVHKQTTAPLIFSWQSPPRASSFV